MGVFFFAASQDLNSTAAAARALPEKIAKQPNKNLLFLLPLTEMTLLFTAQYDIFLYR